MNTYRIEFEGHARNLAGDLIDAIEDTLVIESRSADIEDVQYEVEKQYGQEFGSFYLNAIEVVNTLDTAEVGDGATYTIHSDSQAGTIIARTAKSITWQRDKAELLNGPKSGEEDALVVLPGGFAAHTSGTQRYNYNRDEDGRVIKFTRRELKDKRTGKVRSVRWVASGHGSRSPGCYLSAGRHESYDYNF